MITKPRLLVVDDETANLQKLKRTFHGEFQVDEAKSGEEALMLLGGPRYDVIITDQRMPGISGVDLLRESLKSSPLAIRIILTGFTDVEDLMDAINEGQVHRYVTKPWEPFSLKRTVLQDVELQILRRENQLLAEQLRIAKEVQRQLFPRTLPVVKTLDYVGVCRAAREVGGDYYDFLQFRPEELWMAVGDISGKGISAALLMANLQALLRSRAPLHGASISRLVGDVNQLLFSTTDGSKYASLFCAIFDGNSRRLHYVNAGHCYPVLIRNGANGHRHLEFIESTGTLVGLFPDSPFEQGTVQLNPGDSLLIYTDGVTEAFNRELKEFGEERLMQLAEDHAHLPPRELCDAILKEIQHHSQGMDQSDDLTLVLARVT